MIVNIFVADIHDDKLILLKIKINKQENTFSIFLLLKFRFNNH